VFVTWKLLQHRLLIASKVKGLSLRGSSERLQPYRDALEWTVKACQGQPDQAYFATMSEAKKEKVL
jgi:hypothetical protein